MKKLSFIILLALSSFTLFAKPAFMGGITYKFGTSNNLENLGTTVKVLTSSEDKKVTLGAGASYYPWAKDKQFGLDVGVGYNTKNVNLQAGWDFIANQPAVSLGYAGTIDTSSDSGPVIDDQSIQACKEKTTSN